MRTLLLLAWLGLAGIVYGDCNSSPATQCYHATNSTYAAVNGCFNDRTQCAEGGPAGKMVDGDTLIVPAGNPTWSSSLNIDRNIQLIGAGMGSGGTSIIGATTAPNINVSLTKDVSSGYSFRFSGFSVTTSVSLAGENPYIKVVGKSQPGSSPTPKQLGCVSNVRMDHIQFSNVKGMSFSFDSVFGVIDHCTFVGTGNPTSKMYMTNWTPNGTSSLASNGFGSWADDANWGSEKFIFIEDCYFSGNHNSIADNEQGARVVYRHCTLDTNLVIADHGMEGRAYPGLRAEEIYNVKFINPTQAGSAPGQVRSGNFLLFNNLWTNEDPKNGYPVYIYRENITQKDWGRVSGDNRYDNNDPTWSGSGITNGVCSGTVTADTCDTCAPSTGQGDPKHGDPGQFTDSNPNCFAAVAAGIAANGGHDAGYAVINLDDPFTGQTGNPSNPTSVDPGWRYHGNIITSVSGNTLFLSAQTSGGASGVDYTSARWQIGDHYEIRKFLSEFGQMGNGKATLMNVVNGGYNTYPAPATSGTKAINPQGASTHQEPSYAWNNYTPVVRASGGNQMKIGIPASSQAIKEGRDVFNLGERTPTSTQKIGYDATGANEDNPHATSNYPSVLQSSGSAPYTPYPYPHPCQTGCGPATPQVTGPFSATFATGVSASCPSVNCTTFTSANFSGAPTWSKTGTLPTGVSLSGAGVLSGQPTGATQDYPITVTATYSPAGETATASFVLHVTAPNNPPTCSIKAVNSSSSSALITASACDTDGTIQHVEIYRNGTLVTNLTTSPFTFTDVGLSSGSYSYTAKAYDDKGANAVSTDNACGSNGSASAGVTIVISSAPTPPASIIVRP